MDRYNLYCTEEQTRKALELGAPIEILPNYTEYGGFPFVKCKDANDRPCVIPTAEQIIGWLEEQEDILNINIHLYEDDGYPKMCGYGFTIYNKNKDIIVGTFTEKGNLVYICPKSKEYIYLEGSDNNNFLTKQEAILDAIDAALEYLSNNKAKKGK